MAGLSTAVPRLFCAEPAAELAFLAAAFGAVELGRRADADGRVIHGLVTIGPAMVMVEAEWDAVPCRAPGGADGGKGAGEAGGTAGSTTVAVYLYVDDVDATVTRATAVGSRVLVPAADQFWGDRTAWIADPAGHVWTLAARVEETTAAERDARWAERAAGGKTD
jgi:PhnB protein